MEKLLPERFHGAHGQHVAGYFHKPAKRPMGDLKGELFGVRKNGEEFPIDISLSYFDSGTERIAVSTIRDITDKNKLNREIASSERILREITSVMPAVVYQVTYTREGKTQFTFLSEGARPIIGVDPEAVYKDSLVLFARIHPDDLPRVMAIIADSNAMATKSFHSFRIVMDDGSIRWLQAIGVPKKEVDGTVVRIGYFSDITQAKNAEKMLEESNEKYRAILETTEEMINTLSPDSKILWANCAWRKNLQYSDEDMSQGLALFDMITEESKEGFGERIRILRSGETIRGLKATFIAKDGNKIDVVGTIVPMFDEGQFVGTQAYFRNVTELNKERAERKKAESRWQRTMDNMLTGCMVIGFDWTYLYVNNAAALHAYQVPERLIGKKMAEMYPGVEDTKVFSLYEQCMKNRTPIEFEEKYVFSSGSERWFEFQVEPIEEGIFVMTMDITEKRLAEENIRRNQELLKESQRIAKLGSWELDLVNNALFWSDEVFKIFEIDPKRSGASYEAFLELVHPEDKAIVTNAYDHALKSRTPYDVFHRLLFSDGRIKYLHEVGETFYNHQGVPLRSLGTIHDITQQKEAELLLQQHERNYQQVIENISDALMIDDVSGKIIFCNDQFKEIFGLTDADMGEITLEDIIAPEYRAELRDRHDRRVNGEDVSDFFEFEGLRKGGVRRWFEVHVTNVTQNGKIDGTQSIIRDITDRKVADEERTKMLGEIMQRNKDLEQFSYMVSHNLRAPVANIMALTEFLLDPGVNLEHEPEILTGLSESVHKLDHVIRDLSNILQVRNQVNEQKELVSFSELLSNIRSSIDLLLRSEHVEINANFTEVDEMPAIKSYLYSIFFNLISNSIKYRKVGVSPVIEIKSIKGTDTIELIFKDNGIGIDLAKYRDQIFGLYKRFHYHTEGRGIGLYMVKTQVEVLGGNIYIYSKENEGTTFRIVFDLKRQ